MPFKQPASLAINQARMEHLGSLGLPLEGLSVLEVGAGIGLLTGFFEALNCRVLSTDGRPENIRAIRATYPHRLVKVFDLNSGDYINLGYFKIVFCYGVLYHTADPDYVLSSLAWPCHELLLLETIVWPVDNGQNHPMSENQAISDQSLDGCGCRPARDWIWARLNRLFPYIYSPRLQPNHPEFPLRFPASSDNNTRAVFIASHTRLDLPTLTDILPVEYEGYFVR